MYLNFYGLREIPFSPTPDPKFLFQSARHREALAQLMYGVSERDPFSFAIVSLLLAGISLLACWIATRRALNVNPVVALRCE